MIGYKCVINGGTVNPNANVSCDLFLRGPETFRAYFGCHNSLYIFATPWEGGRRGEHITHAHNHFTRSIKQPWIVVYQAGVFSTPLSGSFTCHTCVKLGWKQQNYVRLKTR